MSPEAICQKECTCPQRLYTKRGVLVPRDYMPKGVYLSPETICQKGCNCPHAEAIYQKECTCPQRRSVLVPRDYMPKGVYLSPEAIYQKECTCPERLYAIRGVLITLTHLPGARYSSSLMEGAQGCPPHSGKGRTISRTYLTSLCTNRSRSEPRGTGR